MGIPAREENEQGSEKLFEEIMTKKFPTLGKEKVAQAQKVQRIPNKLDPNRHITIKMTRLKDKERIIKATREKQKVTYKGAPIRLASD